MADPNQTPNSINPGTHNTTVRQTERAGGGNFFALLLGGAVVAVGIVAYLVIGGQRDAATPTASPSATTAPAGDTNVTIQTPPAPAAPATPAPAPDAAAPVTPEPVTPAPAAPAPAGN